MKIKPCLTVFRILSRDPKSVIKQKKVAFNSDIYSDEVIRFLTEFEKAIDKENGKN